MKAQVLTGLRQMEVRELPQPGIEKDGDVLIRVEVVGVCGSDVHYYEMGRIGSQVVEYPFIVGHECAGVVEEVGAAVKNIKVGDRIVVEPAVWCNECDQCRMGRENTCRNLRFLGTPGQGPGCLCEYIVMPEGCCFAIGDALSFEAGALCEPFAIGVYVVKQSQITEGAKVAILGSGPIGLSCQAAAQAAGAGAVYMTDKIAERMEVAAKAGAVWVGNPDAEDIVKAIAEREPLGLDVVYECAGQQSTLDDAIELLRPGGRLMLIGSPRFERVSFIIDRMRRKEISIVNVRRQNDCTQAAIDLIASGKVNLEYMVTHRFGFEQAQEAFDMVAEYADGVVKAMIKV